MASDSDLEAYLSQLSKKTHTLKQDVENQSYSFSRPTSVSEKSSNSADDSEKSQFLQTGAGKVSDITALSDKYSFRNYKNTKVQDKFSNLQEKYLRKSSKKSKNKSHDINDDNRSESDTKQEEQSIVQNKPKPRHNDSESSIDEELARYLNDSLSGVVESKPGPKKSEHSSDESADRSDVFNIHNIMTVADIISRAPDGDESRSEGFEIKENIHNYSSEISEHTEEDSGKGKKSKQNHKSGSKVHARKNTRVEDILAPHIESIFHSSRRNSTSSIAEVILSRKNSKIDLEAKGEYLGVYREESIEESVPESVPDSSPESESNIAEIVESSVRSPDKIKSSTETESAREANNNLNGQTPGRSVSISDPEPDVILSEKAKPDGESRKSEVEQSSQTEESVSVVKEKKRTKIKASSKASRHHGHRKKKKKSRYISSSSSSVSTSSSSETDSDEGINHRHRHSRSHRHKQKHYFNPLVSHPYTTPWVIVPPQHPYIATNVATGISSAPRGLEGPFQTKNLVDADQLLRQQVALTKQFLDSQRTLYHAYTAMLTSSHHYTSLRETEKYITTRRKPPLTFDEAYKMVKEEMKASKR